MATDIGRFYLSVTYMVVKTATKNLSPLSRKSDRGLYSLGGDLLPLRLAAVRKQRRDRAEFLEEYFLPRLKRLRNSMRELYPAVFLILGNDDARSAEADSLA